MIIIKLLAFILNIRLRTSSGLSWCKFVKQSVGPSTMYSIESLKQHTDCIAGSSCRINFHLSSRIFF